MIPQAHPRLASYPVLAAAAFIGGVGLGRPELVVLGVPFAIVVLAGLVAAGGRAEIDGDMSLSSAVAFEGDEVAVTITVRSVRGAAWIDAEVPADDGLLLAGPPPAAVVVGPGEVAAIEYTLECRRWGVYRPGRLRLHARDRFGLFPRVVDLRDPTVLRVHPFTERVRALVVPHRVGVLVGAHRSPARGDGVEYAETRPFVPGDRLRSVNWRAGARMGGWWVDERHPERTGEVVLFVDSFTMASSADGLDSTLSLAVRAAMALAHGHLGVHDRVGLVGLGGVVRWVTAGVGRRQLHMVVEAILETEVIASEADKGVNVVPVRAMPPRATVVALTPLLDQRSLRFLLELRGRGYDLAVIECSPETMTQPGTSAAAELAWRWWRLERDEQRSQLTAAGAAVARLAPGEPVEAALRRLLFARRRPTRIARTAGTARL